MRALVASLVIVASLVGAAAWAVGPGREQPAVAGASVPFHGGGDLIALATPVGDARQQLTVIDPKTHVISVYHIELATGEISLKSVRNIHWDLQMTEFNGVNPLPRDIRGLLESK